MMSSVFGIPADALRSFYRLVASAPSNKSVEYIARYTKKSRGLSVPVSLILLIQVNCSENMADKSFANSIATFSAKFCNQLDKTKSVVSSPLSAEYVLALLTLGSTEPTHSELLAALGISNDDAIRSSFCEVSSKIRTIEGVTLNVANRVYIKEGNYELDDKLQKDAVNVFDAGIEKVKFEDSQAAASLINHWVESKTNNRIKNILTPDSLNEDTRMVLVNALYFKGDWNSKFDPKDTLDEPFHVNTTTTIKIPMMHKEAEYAYGDCQELDSQILIMPYKGKAASMAIILPSQIDGLDSVMTKLADGFDLMSALKNTYDMKVQVTLPKFKIETEIDLLTVLPKLGITSIFNPQKSGLDNMLKSPEPLYVSKAVQKAFIEVNEEGAEAAAATAAVVMMRCAIMPNRFVANHPFLIAIIAENTPYFVATYRAFAVVKCKAIMNPERLVADRPFLVAIIIKNALNFAAAYRGP